ncbi:MAG: YfhO family protein, partial [Lachnospiraceae bacterium]|nr:YfhO family protein [Lachnospiraceae bacterium]
MGKGKFKLKGILLYSLLFIVTYVVIFFPFLSRSLSTVWEIDGVGQYYPAFLYIGQFIRDFFSTGKFMSFDLRIALGEDVFSALNYYGFGDPLNIIAVFATKSNGAMLFAFMFFLRLYLSGLAFMLYCKYMKLNERLIPVGAFVYVCSGYMFCACLMYIQFLSPLVYFPLLLWACEKFFKEKQWWWMTLISAYAAACTMYLFYYAAIFLVVYALVRCIFLNSKESVNTNVLSRIKNVALDCIMCGIASALGVILAFPITYPSIKGILNSQRANADIKATLTTLTYYKPRIPTIISFFKGFIPTYDEGVYFFHEIPVVSYVAIILLFISYFVLKNKTDRNKQLLIAVVIGCIAYTLPITNIAFSGFADGSSYDRWIFMLAFLFSIVFICSFSDVIELKCKDKSRVYNIVSIATIANVVIIGFLLYEVAGSNFRNAFIDKASVIKYVDSP